MRTYSICTHTWNDLFPRHLPTSHPHTYTYPHTHLKIHTLHLCDIFVIIFCRVFASTFTVSKAHLASALSSLAKWFVMICVDTGIVFPLWMGSLDSAAESLYIWWYHYFIGTLLVYKSSRYSMLRRKCTGCVHSHWRTLYGMTSQVLAVIPWFHTVLYLCSVWTKQIMHKAIP